MTSQYDEALISIHALRGEGDALEGDKTYDRVKFLSTPSAGRATMSIGGHATGGMVFLSTPSAGRATEDGPPW